MGLEPYKDLTDQQLVEEYTKATRMTAPWLQVIIVAFAFGIFYKWFKASFWFLIGFIALLFVYAMLLEQRGIKERELEREIRKRK